MSSQVGARPASVGATPPRPGVCALIFCMFPYLDGRMVVAAAGPRVLPDRIHLLIASARPRVELRLSVVIPLFDSIMAGPAAGPLVSLSCGVPGRLGASLSFPYAAHRSPCHGPSGGHIYCMFLYTRYVLLEHE